MKININIKLDIKGANRDKFLEDLWEEFSEEIDGRITDTYYLVDDSADKEREVEVNVDRISFDYESTKAD